MVAWCFAWNTLPITSAGWRRALGTWRMTIFCLIAQVNTRRCFGIALHWDILKLENLVLDGHDNSHFVELLTVVRVTFRCLRSELGPGLIWVTAQMFGSIMCYGNTVATANLTLTGDQRREKTLLFLFHFTQTQSELPEKRVLSLPLFTYVKCNSHVYM